MSSSFPSGRLVVAALAISLGVGLLMIFGTLSHLAQMAEGMEPFDLRPRGYSLGEARTLLTMLGEEGRRYYATVHQWAANIYPLTFLVSRALVLWWLTGDTRLTGKPVPLAWRGALLLLPLAEIVPDYIENIRILDMIAAGTDLRSELVAAASAATQAKIVLTTATEATVVALSGAVLWRWWRGETN